jgi:glycosyltransferase involved in cell wall biosynthesis
LKITIVEPFFTGSHAQWAKGLQQRSQHQIDLLTLPGRFWKWRMYGGAVELARQFLAKAEDCDLIVASDMLDLTTFLALSRSRTARLPLAVYFHENQLTYPWSSTDPDLEATRNNQYAFLNYTSALAADQLFFNSVYHRDSFLGALPDFLRQFPDYQGLDTLEQLGGKSQVLPLGMDLQALDIPDPPAPKGPPVLLWNHRWEYDKDPEAFFDLIFRLKREGYSFKLIVLGKHYQRQPAIFAKAKKELADHCLHFGYVADRQTYLRYLRQADILPVTSRQDFFGGSIVEAMYCGVTPILPNRLAYPERIPESKKSVYIYEGTEELYQKMRRAMDDVEQLRQKRSAVRSMVAHYDWSRMGPIYDKAFTAMIAK